MIRGAKSGGAGWGVVLGLVLGCACQSIKNTALGPYKMTLRGSPPEVALVCLVTGAESDLDGIEEEAESGKVEFLSSARQRAYWDFVQLLREDGAWAVYPGKESRFVREIDGQPEEGTLDLPLRVNRGLGSEEGGTFVVATKFKNGRWKVHTVKNSEMGQLGGAMVELTSDQMRFEPKP